MKRTIIGWVLAIIGMLLADLTDAFAASAYVQDNALTCRLGRGKYGSWSRDVNGIKNSSTTTKRVFCPLTVPTYDTNSFVNPTISGLYVLYTPSLSGAVPTCREYTVSRTGSTVWSEPGTEDVFYRYYSRSIRFSSVFSNPSSISIGYLCDVPPGGSLQGSFYESNLPPIVDGV